jgi:hypothetical protein
VKAGRAAVFVFAALAAGSPQRGLADQPSRYPVDIIAALPPGPGAGLGTAVLVGRSGQLYHAAAAGRWQRRAGGGVAIDLVAAVRTQPGSDEVIAIGADAPPFRYRAGAWRADPLANRGPALLSADGPLAVLSIGRHIYTLEDGEWKRRASAPHRVTAAWAASATELLVATADGGLARWNGRRFTPVRAPLPADESIVALVGASPAAVFGRAEGGAWIRIDRAGTALVAPAQELASFEQHAWAVGPDASLLLAGAVQASGGARRPILARADRNRLVVAGDLPALPGGDRVAVLLAHAPTGEILIATRAGAVRVRDRRGAWHEGSASGVLPAPPPRPGARSGAPARTR